ncbi:thioesterase II family protein [Actinomadura roseirufa]|uniref:thioesterase II family protein n=1 Tax=Actinomadura roseirufa TaxID=2094049 RepID=UPI0010410751|nr:alpha/beta fold hydrolase [Actinomadura roseirufa]
MSAGSEWFWTPRRRPHAVLRLMCFPHAGADAPAFLALADALPEDIEVRALRMPTRGGARTRPTLAGLTAGAGAELAGTERPYAVLGQSLGGLIGYETARTAAAVLPPVALLTLSTLPPALFALRLEDMFRAGRPSADGSVPGPLRFLLSYLEDNHHEMRAALDDPAVRQIVIRDIWADLTLLRGYRPAAAPRLDCPVHTLVGAGDPSAREADMTGWEHCTTGPVTATTLDTGHFMLQSALPEVARRTVRVLAAWRAAGRNAAGGASHGHTDRPWEER